MEYCLIMIKPGFATDENIEYIKRTFISQGLEIVREFSKKFSYDDIKLGYFSADVEEEQYLNYLTSDKMYVMLAYGENCFHVAKVTKNLLREQYGLAKNELQNLLHTSDDAVEFYLQYSICEELKDLEIDKKGYANLYINNTNRINYRNYEKRALIKKEFNQFSNFNGEYDFYGFLSDLEIGNKKISIINYIRNEKDLICKKSFKIVYFMHDLLNEQILLKLNEIGIRGVLLNYENTDIKDAEIIFEMIEDCQLDWVVIGGGEHISISQRRYNKFAEAIKNTGKWTPFLL